MAIFNHSMIGMAVMPQTCLECPRHTGVKEGYRQSNYAIQLKKLAAHCFCDLYQSCFLLSIRSRIHVKGQAEAYSTSARPGRGCELLISGSAQLVLFLVEGLKLLLF